MGESKHTQGKRRVETRVEDGSAVRKASFVAEVYNDDGILIAQMTCLAHDPEAVDATRADAALDAAAPLMLEALRRITQRASEPRSTTAGAVPVCTVPWALIEEAVAIIRGAGGES